MNVFGAFATIELNTAEFDRAIERVIKKIDEFAVSFENAIIELSKSITMAFDDLALSMRLDYIIDLLTRLTDSFDEFNNAAINTFFNMGNAMDEAIENGTFLQTVINYVVRAITAFATALTIIDSVTFKKILGKLKDVFEAFAAILTALKPKITTFGTKLTGYLTTAVTAVKTAIYKATAGFNPFNAIITKIKATLPKLGIALKVLLGPIGIIAAAIVGLGLYFRHLMETNEKFRERVVGIWNNIKKLGKQIWDDIQSTIADVWKFLEPFIRLALGNILTVIDGAFNNIMNIIELAMNTVRNVIDFVMGVLTGDWERAWGAIENQLQATAGFINNTIENLKNFIVGIMGNIRTFLENFDLFHIGVQIIDGLINGISFAAGRGKDTVRGIADSISGTVRNILGINSPSRAFMDIGRAVCEGFIIGVESMENKIYNTMDDVFGDLDRTINITPRSTAARLQPTFAGGGNVVLQMPITIEAEIYHEMDWDEVGQKLESIARRAIRGKGVAIV